MSNFTVLAIQVKRNINIVLSALNSSSQACRSSALVNRILIEWITTSLDGCSCVACKCELEKEKGLVWLYTNYRSISFSSYLNWNFLITEHDAIVDVIGLVPFTNSNIREIINNSKTVVTSSTSYIFTIHWRRVCV